MKVKKKQVNGHEWFMATETTNSILNSLRAYYSSEIGKEEDRPEPDQERINYMKHQLDEIRPLIQTAGTLSDYDKMQAIIEKYGPAKSD